MAGEERESMAENRAGNIFIGAFTAMDFSTAEELLTLGSKADTSGLEGIAIGSYESPLGSAMMQD